MIYYPLATLMTGGIKEILIISDSKNIESYKRLFSDGSLFGINLEYCVQHEPKGIAEAFIIGENFIKNDNVTLILGDNIFHGKNMKKLMSNSIKNTYENKSVIIGHRVKDPERYGVAVIDKNNKVITIEEKPKKPKSNYAITGLYFYDNQVLDLAAKLKPSNRGELEITDINIAYLKKNSLDLEKMGPGFAWLDTGSIEEFYNTSAFVSALEIRQGLKIACLEEIAFNNKWIGKKNILNAIKFYGKCNYSHYLSMLI